MQIFAEILEVIKPRVIWDIGANSGTYGILAKALAKEAEVYFFEPIPKAVEMINENLQINNFEADVFQLALGDYDGRGKYISPKESISRLASQSIRIVWKTIKLLIYWRFL